MKRAIEFASQSTDPKRAYVNGANSEVNIVDIEEMAVDTNESMLEQEISTHLKSGQQAEIVDLVDTSTEDVSFRKVDSCQTEIEEEIVCLSSDDDEIAIVADTSDGGFAVRHESSGSRSSSRTLSSRKSRKSGSMSAKSRGSRSSDMSRSGSSSGDYWSEEEDDVTAHPVTFNN